MAIYKGATLVKRIYKGATQIQTVHKGSVQVYPTPSITTEDTTTTSCTTTTAHACSILADDGASWISNCVQLDDLVTGSIDWDEPTPVSGVLKANCTPSVTDCIDVLDVGNITITCVPEAGTYCLTVDWNTGTTTTGRTLAQCVEDVSQACSSCGSDLTHTRTTCTPETGTYCLTVDWVDGTPVTGLLQNECTEFTSEACTICPHAEELNHTKVTCTNEAGTYCTNYDWGDWEFYDDDLTSCSGSTSTCLSCADTSPAHYEYDCVNQATTYCSGWAETSTTYTYGSYYSNVDNCNNCTDGINGEVSIVSSTLYSTSCDMSYSTSYTYSEESTDTAGTESCSICSNEGNEKVTTGSYVAGACLTASMSYSYSYVRDTACNNASGSCSCSYLGNTNITCYTTSTYKGCSKYLAGAWRDVGCTTSAGCSDGLWEQYDCEQKKLGTCTQTSSSSGYYPTYTYECEIDSQTNTYRTGRRICYDIQSYYQQKNIRYCEVTGSEFYVTKVESDCEVDTTEFYQTMLEQDCEVDTTEFYQTKTTFTCENTLVYTPQWTTTTSTCSILEA